MPPLPRLATLRGLKLVRVGAGFKPVATLATYFKKVIKIEVREVLFWVARAATPAIAPMGSGAPSQNQRVIKA
jgi:hypothetical protein